MSLYITMNQQKANLPTLRKNAKVKHETQALRAFGTPTEEPKKKLLK